MLLLLEGFSSFFFKNGKLLLILGAAASIIFSVTHVISLKEQAAAKLQEKLTAQQVQIEQISKDRDTNATNFAAAKQVADDNQKVILQLQADKQAVAEANISLDKQLHTAHDFKLQLSTVIANATLAQDGKVADVVRDTIDAIQKNRAERQQ